MNNETPVKLFLFLIKKNARLYTNRASKTILTMNFIGFAE